MPYDKISDAPANIRKLDDAELTLGQINWIAKHYDALKEAEQKGDIQSAMGVAIGQFKKAFKKVGDKWEEKEKENMSYIGGECICLKDESGNETGRFKKEILRVGKWIHPVTKKAVEFTKENLKDLTNNFKLIGRKVYITLSHFVNRDTENNVGEIENIDFDGNKLYAIMNIREAGIIDKIKKGIITLCSPGIEKGFVNTDGKEYNLYLEHVALGESAVIQPQENFIGLNAIGNDMICYDNPDKTSHIVAVYLNNNIIKEVKVMNKLELTQEELNLKIEQAKKEAVDNLKAEIKADEDRKVKADKIMIDLKAIKEKEVTFSKASEELISNFFKSEKIELKADQTIDALIDDKKQAVFNILKSIKETGLVNLKTETGDSKKDEKPEVKELAKGESREMKELTLSIEKHAVDNKISFMDAMNLPEFQKKYQEVLNLENEQKAHYE